MQICIYRLTKYHVHNTREYISIIVFRWKVKLYPTFSSPPLPLPSPPRITGTFTIKWQKSQYSTKQFLGRCLAKKFGGCCFCYNVWVEFDFESHLFSIWFFSVRTHFLHILSAIAAIYGIYYSNMQLRWLISLSLP